MPPWFDHWYHQQLLAVHQKLKDPDESGYWLDDLLKKAGAPPSDPDFWKQQIEQTIKGLPASNSEESLPHGWEKISLSDQNTIKAVFAGISPLQLINQGEALENLLSPLLSGRLLTGKEALWVWQYLLEQIGMAEENLMRHWVDAEEKNLQAFEERFELHDQIRRIPGTISVEPADVWHACYPDTSTKPAHRPLGKRTKILMLVTMIFSVVAAFSAVLWVRDAKGETIHLTNSLSAQMLDGHSSILMERNQLSFNGEVKLMVGIKDSIRMLGGLVIFDPGVYLVRLEEENRGTFSIESGHLKAFLGEEVFVLEEGMVLENESGFWLKEWE